MDSRAPRGAESNPAWLWRLGPAPGRAELGRAEPGRAEPGRAELGQAEPDRAEPGPWGLPDPPRAPRGRSSVFVAEGQPFASFFHHPP